MSRTDRRSHRIRKVLVALAIAIYAMGLFGLGAAYGSNGRNTKMGQNLADSSISVGQIDLTTVFHDAIHDTMFNNMDPTDIYADPFHSSGRDLEVFDFNYSAAWYGIWECHAWFVENIGGPPIICQASHVHLDLSQPPGGTYSATEARSLVCEEVGHGSLSHSGDSDSCMSQDWADTRWNTHDKGIVNGLYAP